MSKTLGQALDDYLADTFTVESVFLYYDKEAQPHVVVTVSDSGYDYTEIFTIDHNLNAEVAEKRKEVKALQDKIRGLERDKKSVESAIRKITKSIKL